MPISAKFVKPPDNAKIPDYEYENNLENVTTIAVTTIFGTFYLTARAAETLAGELETAAEDSEDWADNAIENWRCSDEEILTNEGWEIVSKEPFGIRHTDGSMASGKGAELILEKLRE